MIKLSVDSDKNVLLVTLLGTSSDKDIVNGVGEAGTLLHELKENLNIIMDLSKFRESSTEQGALFNKIIKTINDKVKIHSVIRVIGESKSIIVNLCKMDKLFNLNNVKYVPTLEDAYNFIDGTDFNQKECK